MGNWSQGFLSDRKTLAVSLVTTPNLFMVYVDGSNITQLRNVFKTKQNLPETVGKVLLFS